MHIAGRVYLLWTIFAVVACGDGAASKRSEATPPEAAATPASSESDSGVPPTQARPLLGPFAYSFVNAEEHCETGEKRFGSLTEMCLAILSSPLNNWCAPRERYEKFT